MSKQYRICFVSLIIIILFAVANSLKESRTANAQPTNLLSAPYFGTTRVRSIFDHEYPVYDEEVDRDFDPLGQTGNMIHRDNQRLDDPFQPGGNGNIYCVGYSGHDGIDYGLYYDYIRAAHSGQVIKAGWASSDHRLSFGLHVVLETTYNNVTYQTVYGHLSVILVKAGSEGINPLVPEGKIIGISGDTGNSTGPHLHFTVQRPGSDGVFYAVNPYGWNSLAQDPWDQQTSRPPSINLWKSFPSVQAYSTCTQLPYPDGPEIPYPVSGDPPLTPNLTAPPYTTIVDDNTVSPRFELVGPSWVLRVCTTSCYGGYSYYTPTSTLPTFARYRPDADELLPGQYDIYAFIPAGKTYANAKLANYTIYHNNQIHWAGINQKTFNDPPDYPRQWAYLGRYDFASGGVASELVQLFHEGDTGENLAADAVAFVFVDGPPDIIEEVATSSDDAGMDPIPSPCSIHTTFDLTRQEIYFGYCNNSTTPVVSGLRFSSVPIPVGSIVTRAIIRFLVDGPENGPDAAINVRFYGEPNPNSPTFSGSNLPSHRSLTQSSVVWNVPSSAEWVWYETRYSPNLAPVVQEIVNLPGWTSGNSSLTFIVKPNPFAPIPPTASRSRRVMSYDRIADPPAPPGTNDAHLFVWLACSTPPCPGQ